MDRVYIRNLHIEQVRHLGDIDIPLVGDDDAPRHLILTGKNGSGKTSVLDSMAGFIDSVCCGQCPSEFQRRIDGCAERLEHYRRDPEQNKERIRQDEGNLRSFQSRLKNARHGIDIEFNMDDTDVCAQYGEGGCLFAYFRAKRQFDAEMPKQIEKVVFADRYGIDDTPRNMFVKYLLDLKMTQALAATGGRSETAEEIQRWFDRIRDILRVIHEDPTLTLEFDEETYEFSICEQGRDPYNFNEASDGFSAILDVVVGLMLRMVKKNGRSPNFNMPGIALVDEIENHLHLSLQKRVLPILVELFPNIQFVVSTHSPFVLSSLGGAVVYDLENHICASRGLSDNTYESIVEGYFGVDALSDELRQKYDRYRELAARDSLSDAEFLEARGLERYLDEIPDFLDFGVTTEYLKSKLELHAKVVDE